MVNKYQCIRKCFAYGRKWEKGEMLQSDFTPSHHFVIVEGQPNIPVHVKSNVLLTTNQNVHDPMNPIDTSGAVNFSQMQGQGSPIKTGMAHGMGDDRPMASHKEFKTAQEI